MQRWQGGADSWLRGIGFVDWITTSRQYECERIPSARDYYRSGICPWLEASTPFYCVSFWTGGATKQFFTRRDNLFTGHVSFQWRSGSGSGKICMSPWEAFNFHHAVCTEAQAAYTRLNVKSSLKGLNQQNQLIAQPKPCLPVLLEGWQSPLGEVVGRASKWQ